MDRPLGKISSSTVLSYRYRTLRDTFEPWEIGLWFLQVCDKPGYNFYIYYVVTEKELVSNYMGEYIKEKVNFQAKEFVVDKSSTSQHPILIENSSPHVATSKTTPALFNDLLVEEVRDLADRLDIPLNDLFNVYFKRPTHFPDHNVKRSTNTDNLTLTFGEGKNKHQFFLAEGPATHFNWDETADISSAELDFFAQYEMLKNRGLELTLGEYYAKDKVISAINDLLKLSDGSPDARDTLFVCLRLLCEYNVIKDRITDPIGEPFDASIVDNLNPEVFSSSGFNLLGLKYKIINSIKKLNLDIAKKLIAFYELLDD